MTDLLVPENGTPRRLTIVKDKFFDIHHVIGATKVNIDFDNPKALARIYKQGLNRRKMRASDINETSSRSHLMF